MLYPKHLRVQQTGDYTPTRWLYIKQLTIHQPVDYTSNTHFTPDTWLYTKQITWHHKGLLYTKRLTVHQTNNILQIGDIAQNGYTKQLTIHQTDSYTSMRCYTANYWHWTELLAIHRTDDYRPNNWGELKRRNIFLSRSFFFKQTK